MRSDPRARSCGRTGRPVFYTVTLEPHWKHWLFALDMPGSLPQTTASDAEAMRTDIDAVLTRDQQLVSRLPVTQPLRYQQTSALRDSYPAGRGRSSTATSATTSSCPRQAAATIRRRSQFARELRARASRRRRLHRRRARLVQPRIVLLYAGAAAARRQSGGRFPVRDAPRLLRALRERVRRACCAPRAFRRAWSPATRAARSIRAATT